MLDWLQSIGDFLVTIGQFLISFFKNVIEMVTLIFKGVVYVGEVLVFMPQPYQLIIFACISYIVIVTILHFGG